MLQRIVDSLDDIPEAIRSEYVETDGKFHLQVDIGKEKDRISEFRNKNVKLLKELDDIKKKFTDIDPVKYKENIEELNKFADIDPEKYAEMKSKLDDIESKKLIDAGKLDELVKQEISRAEKNYQVQIKKIKQDQQKDISTLRSEIEAKETNLIKTKNDLLKTKIDNDIVKEVNDVGNVRSGAMEDILARAHRIWRIEDGEIVPRNLKGDIIFGNDGEKITYRDWTKTLLLDAPHLWQTSVGGGAAGGGNGGHGIGSKYGKDFDKLPIAERLKRINEETK